MKIYQPTGRAREYSPLALNYFKGCTHGCVYCYMTNMNKRFGNGVVQNICTPPSDKGLKELERSAKAMEGCNKQILLSFTSDPYADLDPEYTRQVLNILNKYNHKVAVLTKGGSRVLRDLDLFKSFGNRIKIGATLTFNNKQDSLTWEPGGADPEERIESLKTLSENGIIVWASFEPVIIPEQSLELIKKVSPFIDHIKIGKLNNYKGYDKKINWSDFIHKAVSICRTENVKFYIKNDLSTFNTNADLTASERDADFFNL